MGSLGGSRSTNLHDYNFWDKEIRVQEGMLKGALLLPIHYTTSLIGACLSLSWGSLVLNSDVTKIRIEALIGS